MGKGSGRRPQLADEQKVANQWETIFGKGKRHDSNNHRDSGTHTKEEINQPGAGTGSDADSVPLPP